MVELRSAGDSPGSAVPNHGSCSIRLHGDLVAQYRPPLKDQTKLLDVLSSDHVEYSASSEVEA